MKKTTEKSTSKKCLGQHLKNDLIEKVVQIVLPMFLVRTHLCPALIQGAELVSQSFEIRRKVDHSWYSELYYAFGFPKIVTSRVITKSAF